MTEIYDVEALLRSALVPVEPSEALSDRLERGLTEIADLAAEELADWELSTMRDPRNWARPAGAVIAGSVAGGALIVVRARQRQKRRTGGLGREMRSALGDLSKRLGG
jgi:hypothetical protein